MVRTNQGGSILGFVIVGGVLALLLVGGAYFVRHQLASTAAEDTEPVVTQNSAGDSGESEDKNNEEPKDEATEFDSDKGSEQTGEVTTLPGSTDDSSSEDKEDTPVATDLPQTGPADVLLGSVLIGSVVGATVAYKRSRDTVASL